MAPTERHTTKRFRDPRIAELAEQLNCLTVDELLDTAIEVIPPLVKGRYVTLYLVGDDGEHLQLLRKNHERPVAESVAMNEPSLLLEVFRRQQAILIHDVMAYIEENGLATQLDRRSRYTSGSCMLCPLWAKLPQYTDRQIIGVINIADKTDFTIFSKDELRFSATVGELLGESIVHTQIIQSKLGGQRQELESELEELKGTLEKQEAIGHSLDEARARVMTLLPEPPTDLAGYHFHVRYHPLDAIVGDFYDFFEAAPDKRAIVFADISGTGVEAALIMSMAKQVLTICGKAQPKPIDALTLANQEVHSSFAGQTTVACFYGVIDTRYNQLTFIRAGAPAPLLLRPGADPVVRQLDNPGFPLGMLMDQQFADRLQSETLQLADGDQLLLYSAYTIAATNPAGEAFGIERLMAAFERHAALPPEELTGAIDAEIREFVGPATVDWTLLVMRCDGLTLAAAVEAVDAPLAEVEEGEFLVDDAGLFFQEDVDDAVAAAQAAAPAEAAAPVEAAPAPVAEAPADPLEVLLEVLHAGDGASGGPPPAFAERLASLRALQDEIHGLEVRLKLVDEDDDDEVAVHPPFARLRDELADLELDEDILGWLEQTRYDEALAELGQRLVTAEASGDLDQIEAEIRCYVRVARALGPTI